VGWLDARPNTRRHRLKWSEKSSTEVKWNICSKTGEFSQFLPETGAVCQMRTGSRGMFTVYKRDTSVFCLKRICKAFVCIQFHQHCPCNPQAVVLLVTLPKTGRNLPKMIFQYLRRFFAQADFSATLQQFSSLCDPRKWTYWISKSFILTKTNTISPQQKRGLLTVKTPKKQTFRQ